jgi:cardiolipin synthase
MVLFGLSLWQVVIRAFLTLVVLQIITLTLITITYKRRRKQKPQTAYRTIPLEPCLLEEAELQLYMDGVSLFADMQNAIEAAREVIYFETFIWKDDATGQAFRELVIRKAREGVSVYLVYDLIGNRVLGGSRLKFPKDIETLHLVRYFSFKRLRHCLSPSRYNVTHRKSLIIDNEVAFIGGYNIGEEYRTKWRDTHLRAKGEIALRLAYAFIDFWNHYGSRSQPKLAYPKQVWSNVLDVYRNDPMRRNYPIRSIYLRAIERAQDHVLITNAYFVPDPAFRQALIDAAQRGVDVQVILPWQSNHLVVDWVARHYFSDYLDAGIKLFGYEAAMIHTKTVTIDGRWSLIGTANLDRLSLAFNHEINIEIFDEQVAQQMEAIFNCDRRQTRTIEQEMWENRPIRQRLGELILSPLWPLV